MVNADAARTVKPALVPAPPNAPLLVTLPALERTSAVVRPPLHTTSRPVSFDYFHLQRPDTNAIVIPPTLPVAVPHPLAPHHRRIPIPTPTAAV